MRDYLILGIIFATLPFCFFRPFFGVLMWYIVGFLNPHRFAFGIAYDFPVAQLVGIPTLAGFLLFHRNWKNLFCLQVFALFVLWVWFTFTTFHNSAMPMFQHFAADTIYRWQFVTKILVMTLVTVAVVDTWERLRILLLTISWCFGVLVVKAVPFMIATGGSFRLYGPPGSMVADNNDLGLVLNMTLPIFFFLARTETNDKMRKALWFVFIFTIPAILFTYSRGALIGLSLVMFLMIMRLPQRFVLIPVLLVSALFATMFTPDRWQKRMDFRREGALIDDSAMSRFNAWRYSWNLANDYPMTGAGFDAYTPPLFDRYAPNRADVHGPHSIYFGVLAEHGFPGLFLYLVLLACTLLTLQSVFRYARRWGDELAGAYAPMLQFSLLAFMVSGAFLGRAYFDYYFTIIACTIVLRRLSKDEEAALIREEQEDADEYGIDPLSTSDAIA
jgi:probable O-glycosylation ligase (exosortase A-associated)